MEKKFYVITRYKRDFLRWCVENGVPPYESQWIGHPDKLAGCSFREDQVIRTGWAPDLITSINEMVRIMTKPME